ncbi:hypothetical protein [Paraburkholderia sp.]|uniref:hypothetical protein n=1 Tax=Paraburkholderia sp. TaxID=1926495 RepID=UPI002394B159|nr:hypothetical protein [Paraburkholderia sp.]MDE1179415.1 hypothetical protein [Paraburkholderia sp.]
MRRRRSRSARICSAIANAAIMLDSSAVTTGLTPPNSIRMPNAAEITSERIENSTTAIDDTYHSTVRERAFVTS